MSALAATLLLGAGWLLALVIGLGGLWLWRHLTPVPVYVPEPETLPLPPEPLRPIPDPVRCPGCGRLLNVPGDLGPVCSEICTRLQKVA